MTRLLLFILLCSVFTAFSQKIKVEYKITGLHNVERSPKTEFKDSNTLIKYLTELRNTSFKENYVEFSIDSAFTKTNGALVIYGMTGDRYSHVSLNIEPTEMEFLNRKISMSKNGLSIEKMNPENLHKRIQEITQFYSNNGYPFCNLHIEELRVENLSFQGALEIDRGPKVFWKKLHIKGDSSLNTKFISSLINIKEGDLYSEKPFSQITEVINNTAYLSERSSPEVLFTKEGAELYLYLDNIPRSSVNGIVGFQPDPVSGRLNFTGDVRLKLLNVLKHGENLNVNWQSVAKQTQSLRSSFRYPYLFNTPFGLGAEFNLYKRDTSFIETEGNFGIGYNLNPNWNIQVFYSRKSSNLLSGTFIGDDERGAVKTNGYGISTEKISVDYLPNPTRGYTFEIKAQGGLRSFQRNDTLPKEKDQTLRSELNVGYYIPMLPRHIIFLANQTAFYSAEDIFSNELYRFGGLLEQRGFNEDELLASTRSTFTFEYRFLLDKNSNVFAFFDLSWYERKTLTYLRDIPMGAGFGLSFSSNVGVFNLAYAIGQQMNNGFQLANSKIHFGYTAVF